MQKNRMVYMLCALAPLSLFGKNPQNVEQSYKGSYQKPEFLMQYDTLVNTKEAKKISSSKAPLKLLNYEFLNKWKLAGNLLVTDIRNDTNLAIQTAPRVKANFEQLITNLNGVLKDLYQQATILIEQTPIAFYKKPLLKRKPKYDDAEIDAARSRLRKTVSSDTVRSLGDLRKEASSIQFDIRMIKENNTLTDGEKNLCTYAAEFGNMIADLSDNLEQEIKNLK